MQNRASGHAPPGHRVATADLADGSVALDITRLAGDAEAGGGYSAASAPAGSSRYDDPSADATANYILQLSAGAVVRSALALAAAGAAFILCAMGSAGLYVAFVFIICTGGFAYAVVLARGILAAPTGSKDMHHIAGAIREAAEGFLRTQFGAVGRYALVVSVVLFLVYALREASPTVKLPGLILAGITMASFLAGAFCSGTAGYIGVWISVRANLRVAASAAAGNGEEALLLSFRGGAFSAIVSACMCMMGLTVLYAFFYLLCVRTGWLEADHVPLLLAGYGFGASFVALFMQVAGGIYTKAADVGADLVGKVDHSIPEDDPRNPAVIADLVGDNVGDCAGSMADVFESIAAEILGTMILAGALVSEAKFDGADRQGYLFFPLVVHALDVVVSTCGMLCVRPRPGDSSPLVSMHRGYAVTAVLAIIALTCVCKLMLDTPAAPGAWVRFWLCGALGVATAFVLLFVCQYYTDYAYGPVQGIAAASKTGHGTNVIQGLAVGFESTGLPSLIICFDLAAAYYLGEGAVPQIPVTSGLYGTAVATMGILCTAVFILSMNNFGPIADNAGGIVEMSGQTEEARRTTDALDAVGNVTKAATKGYAVGGSAMAFFLLYRAYMDDVAAFSGQAFDTVNVGKIEVLIGGIAGVAMVFVFTGWTMAAVGVTAQAVVVEVRRQFSEFPGIMEGTVRPQYGQCTSMVTRAALRQAAAPVALALLSPIIVGVLFRGVGAWRGEKLLAVQVLAGFMIFGSVTALLMAMFLDNAGGAWDNAKKYIEGGAHGGKGSEAHKAAVTGDTVGDPAKDTSGPSLHVVITTMSTTILVLCPLFIS